MKNKSTSSHRSARRRVRIAAGFMLLLASQALVSCGTTSIRPSHSSPARVDPVDSVNWERVKDNPPVYFPKGIAADQPTGCWDGVWIPIGDEEGTRYFVPSNCGNRQVLINSALARVTPEEQARTAQKKAGRAAKRTARTAVAVPGLLIIGMFSAYH